MNKKISSAISEFLGNISPSVYFADLTVEIIRTWFKKFAHLLVENDPRSFQDREYLAVTVWKDIGTETYQIIQVIFDNKNQTIYDARVIKADSVDSVIKQAHSDGKIEIALWQ